MSTGFKRTGTAVGANAPSSGHAKSPKPVKSPKHSTTPHDQEFRRPNSSVGPSSSSSGPNSQKPVSVSKQAKAREKMDKEANRDPKKDVEKEKKKNEKKNQKKEKSFMDWFCCGGGDNKKPKKKEHKISAHDTGFQKSGSSGVGPQTSSANNEIKKEYHPKTHSISPQDTGFKRSVSPAPLSTEPRKTVYTSSPSPQDTGFKKTGSEVGPKKAKQNNELAYHHSPGRSDPSPPVNAANPAAYVNYCDQCGHKLPSVAKFCDHCGARI